MRALTVAPGIADSARLEDVADPPPSDGAVRALALGVCGTDREIVSGAYGWAPPGERRLVIGHESLGSVEEAPAGCGVEAGDHVVAIVRRPDPVPCGARSGAPSVVRDVLGRTAPGGIVCLVGVTAPGHDFDIDIGELNRTMVLDNDTLFGTVNANRRHYELAGEALQRADKAWLNRLITRREPLERWTDSLERQPDDIKVIVDFS
jgi:threonine dehydrogenase-like Zn-dependent dehydrogenase